MENGKITLDWSDFDDYLHARLEAGTLTDEGGVVFDEITGYQIVYVLRDKNGKQLGYQITRAVSGDKSKLELDVETAAATIQGVSPEEIASAKIVSISVVGKDVNEKQIKAFICFATPASASMPCGDAALFHFWRKSYGRRIAKLCPR